MDELLTDLGLLPRAWRLAFGEWNLPRQVGEPDDFHKMTRSKVYRAKLWLSHADTEWKAWVMSLCTEPVDHLMMVTQKIDAVGGILEELLCPRKNVFVQCGRAYASLIMDDWAPTKSILQRYVQPHGPCFVVAIMSRVLACCLSLAGYVWKSFTGVFGSWPYKLVALCCPGVPMETRKGVAVTLVHAAMHAYMERARANHIRLSGELVGGTRKR